MNKLQNNLAQIKYNNKLLSPFWDVESQFFFGGGGLRTGDPFPYHAEEARIIENIITQI